MVLREKRVPADITQSVVAQPFTFVIDEDVDIVIEVFLYDSGFFLLHRQVQVFGQAGQIVSSRVVGLDHLIAFGHVGDATSELLKKTLLNARLNLRKDVPSEDLEVLNRALPETL